MNSTRFLPRPVAKKEPIAHGKALPAPKRKIVELEDKSTSKDQSTTIPAPKRARVSEVTLVLDTKSELKDLRFVADPSDKHMLPTYVSAPATLTPFEKSKENAVDDDPAENLTPIRGAAFASPPLLNDYNTTSGVQPDSLQPAKDSPHVAPPASPNDSSGSDDDDAPSSMLSHSLSDVVARLRAGKALLTASKKHGMVNHARVEAIMQNNTADRTDFKEKGSLGNSIGISGLDESVKLEKRRPTDTLSVDICTSQLNNQSDVLAVLFKEKFSSLDLQNMNDFRRSLNLTPHEKVLCTSLGNVKDTPDGYCKEDDITVKITQEFMKKFGEKNADLIQSMKADFHPGNKNKKFNNSCLSFATFTLDCKENFCFISISGLTDYKKLKAQSNKPKNKNKNKDKNLINLIEKLEQLTNDHPIIENHTLIFVRDYDPRLDNSFEMMSQELELKPLIDAYRDRYAPEVDRNDISKPNNINHHRACAEKKFIYSLLKLFLLFGSRIRLTGIENTFVTNLGRHVDCCPSCQFNKPLCFWLWNRAQNLGMQNNTPSLGVSAEDVLAKSALTPLENRMARASVEHLKRIWTTRRSNRINAGTAAAAGSTNVLAAINEDDMSELPESTAASSDVHHSTRTTSFCTLGDARPTAPLSPPRMTVM